jgi:hypothetical protein
MISGAGTAFTDADVQRGAGLFGSERRTQQQREEETRDAALTDNTSAIGKLSDAFNSWTMQHPVATAAVQSGGGLVGSAVGGALAGRVAGAAAPAVVSAGGAAGILTRLGLGGAAFAGGAAIGEGFLRLTESDAQRRRGGTTYLSEAVTNPGGFWGELGRTARHWTGTEEVQEGPRAQAHITEQGMREGMEDAQRLADLLAGAIRQTLPGVTLQVNVPPLDAAAARGQQAMGGSAPPPESRGRS